MTPAALETPRPKVQLRVGAGWLIIPPLIFVAAAYFTPLVEMGIMSLTDPSPHNYAAMLETPLYVRTLATTFKIALIVTAVCILIGYPYAYVMHLGGKTWRAVLTLMVLLPFMSSMLARTFSWQTLLGDQGVINRLLTSLHLTDHPIPLMGNTTGTVIGMSHILLPYLVLPTYAAMRTIDTSLMAASLSLGASRFKTFARVFLPLSVPGTAAGSVLVFVSSLGFYVTPALLGGPKDMMLSQLIVQQISPLLQFGMASALGVVLLVVTVLALGVSTRFVPLGMAMGYEGRK